MQTNHQDLGTAQETAVGCRQYDAPQRGKLKPEADTRVNYRRHARIEPKVGFPDHTHVYREERGLSAGQKE